MPHQPTRFCICKDSVDFGCGESSVYRNGGNPEPAAGIYQLDVLRRIWQQKREAVARRKTVLGERSCDALDALVKSLKGDAGTIDNERRTFWIISGSPAERINIDHVPFTACDTCASLTSRTTESAKHGCAEMQLFSGRSSYALAPELIGWVVGSA